MDKKNTILGVVFIAAALILGYVGIRNSAQHPTPAAIREAVAQQTAGAKETPAPAVQTPASATASAQPAPAADQPTFATVAADASDSNITILENDFVQFRLTDHGGAIRDAAFKKYPAQLNSPEPYVLNQLHANPMLALVNYPGLDQHTKYTLVSHTATEAVYRATLPGGLEVTRRYIVSPDQVGSTDPYQIKTEITFTNHSKQLMAPTQIEMAIGTAAPTDALDKGYQLATASSNGKDQTFTLRSSLEASGGFLGMTSGHPALASITTPGPIAWGAVSNTFFTGIYTPGEPGVGLVTRRIKLLTDLPDTDRNAYGVAAAAQLSVPAILPNGSVTLLGEYYAGPREYKRLANTDVFKEDQAKIMNFGMFKFFSQSLLILMTWIHSALPNWGVAIALTTLLLRGCMMFLTIPAARSARRMQKIAPEMKALREKYKDNPQKQQMAMMELYKKHKVNPFGGCIPMLLTMPFFFGFYSMLRGAAELRFAPFLWAKDLSAPDTVFVLNHIPILGTLDINLLPIIMCAVTFLQFRFTPQPTMDSSQATMMKLSPLFMLWIYYTYSCALSLYSTVNGLFMIGQQIIINRMKDDGDPADTAPVKAGGKPVKNVTPGKRR